MSLVDAVQMAKAIGVDDRPYRRVDANGEVVGQQEVLASDVKRLFIESMPSDWRGCSWRSLRAGYRCVNRRWDVVAEAVAGKSGSEAERRSRAAEGELDEVVVSLETRSGVDASGETLNFTSVTHPVQAPV